MAKGGGGGIEIGRSLAGAAPVSGLSRMDYGPAFGAAPSRANFGVGWARIGHARGDLNIFGAKLTVPSQSFVKEGPVKRSFLENSMPIQASVFNKKGELRFQAPKSSNPKTRTLDEIRTWLGESQIKTRAKNRLMLRELIAPKAKIVEFPFVVPKIGRIAAVKPVLSPALEVEKRRVLKSKNERYLKTEKAVKSEKVISLKHTVLSQPEELEEQILRKKEKFDTKEVLDEEERRDKKVYVEDKPVAKVRKFEIRLAIAKAIIEAVRLGLKKITGRLVRKFMPEEHDENRSEIVKKHAPDGSYEETKDAIEAIPGFNSQKEAIEKADKIVAEKKPVKRANDGEPVKIEDIWRVLKHRWIRLDRLSVSRLQCKNLQS